MAPDALSETKVFVHVSGDCRRCNRLGKAIVLSIRGEQKFLADLKREGYTYEMLNLCQKRNPTVGVLPTTKTILQHRRIARLTEPRALLVGFWATYCLQNVTNVTDCNAASTHWHCPVKPVTGSIPFPFCPNSKIKLAV